MESTNKKDVELTDSFGHRHSLIEQQQKKEPQAVHHASCT